VGRGPTNGDEDEGGSVILGAQRREQRGHAAGRGVAFTNIQEVDEASAIIRRETEGNMDKAGGVLERTKPI
jgi:hypothetical protein